MTLRILAGGGIVLEAETEDDLRLALRVLGVAAPVASMPVPEPEPRAADAERQNGRGSRGGRRVCPKCGKGYSRWHRRNAPCPSAGPTAPVAPNGTARADACPRCGGRTHDEAGDTVCLTCGYRVVGDEFGALRTVTA